MECRKEMKKLLSQQMATVREEMVTKCPPWTYVALDYAGPVTIKGEVNKRSRGKGWILIYVCRSTKAVCLLPTSSYGTAAFLCRHEESLLPRKILLRIGIGQRSLKGTMPQTGSLCLLVGNIEMAWLRVP